MSPGVFWLLGEPRIVGRSYRKWPISDDLPHQSGGLSNGTLVAQLRRARRACVLCSTHKRERVTMKAFVKTLLAGLAAVALTAASANAATIIDFGTGFGGAGGTINIGANITGSGIFIDTVT